jgi:hypothetical protein
LSLVVAAVEVQIKIAIKVLAVEELEVLEQELHYQ